MKNKQGNASFLLSGVCSACSCEL